MNITKTDLFYVLMAIAVSAVGVLAVFNIDTELGLYSLLGLIGLMMIFVIIIKPSVGANLLILAIFINIAYVLNKQGFTGGIEPLVIIVAFALLVRNVYVGQTIISHSKTFRIQFFLLFYFVIVAASFF